MFDQPTIITKPNSVRVQEPTVYVKYPKAIWHGQLSLERSLVFLPAFYLFLVDAQSSSDDWAMLMRWC